MKHLAGIYSGMWLGLLPGILAQVILWSLVYALDGSLSLRYVWVYFLPLLLVNLSLALNLVTVMGLLVRRTVVLVITWVAFWILLSLLRQGIEEFRPFQEAALLTINFENMKISPALGFGLYHPTVMAMVIWFLGIALLGLGLAALLYPLVDRRRALRDKRPALFSIAASSAILVIGYLANQSVGRASAIPTSPFDIQLNRWYVAARELDLSLDADRGAMLGSATLTLLPQVSIEDPLLVLKLNPGLEVTEITTGDGKSLHAERHGDSLVITLSETPRDAVTLNLSWEGTPRIPYPDYQMRWSYQAPLVPRTDTPQPVGALLLDGIGFLARDGDWHPWPWTNSPHQAEYNHVAIQVRGDAMALPPSGGQALQWQGKELPSLLLVLPPERNNQHDDIQLHFGVMSGSVLVEKLELYANAAKELWRTIGMPPPHHIVAMPYISEIILSSDLLLVPEGSAYYHSPSILPLFSRTASLPEVERAVATARSTSFPELERAVAAALARQWFFELVPPPPALYIQALPRGTGPVYQIVGSVTNETVIKDEYTWEQLGGRWVQPLHIPDASYNWTPRLEVALKPPGELSAVAAWIAIELSPPQLRQDDLETLRRSSAGKPETHSGSQQRELDSALLPFVLIAPQAREIVLSLHDWAVEIGMEHAVRLTLQTIRETHPQRAHELFTELEVRSGSPIQEVEK
jgi:hypothetical protein